MKTALFPAIEKEIKTLNIDQISNERKDILNPLINFIQDRVSKQQDIRLNFICTHNSRRSHLSQVWAQTMATYFNINNVFCYSGGTEVTALFPMVAEVLKDSGFQINVLSDGNNPVYSIKYAENEHPVIGFSKIFDDVFNPKSSFAALMTCDSANEACPIVHGSEIKIPVTFEDPKVFDNTLHQELKYKERSLEIAGEMFYVFSKINS